MSKFAEYQTQFSDPDVLCQALGEMGFTANMIERNQTAQQLFDYHNRPTKYLDSNGDKAEIVIRRAYVNSVLSGGASNDIGFKRDSKGHYSAIISQFDSNYANAAWMKKLSTAYCEKGILKKAKQQGYSYAGKQMVNGKIQLQFIAA